MISKAGIQLHNTQEVHYEAGPGRYPILTGPQLQQLLKWLKNNHSTSDVDTVEGLIRNWKDDCYCDDAQTLGRIFKSALGINAPVRNGNLSGRAPQGDEEAIAREIKQASEEFMYDLYGQQIIAYRGAGHALPNLLEDLLNNYSHRIHNVNSNALSNYTPSLDVAETFGTVILEQTIRPNSIAIAADCVFPYKKQNGNLGKCHGELRVRGDQVSQLQTSNIRASGTPRMLLDLFLNPTQNSLQEHQVAAGVIKTLANNGRSVSTQAANKLIDPWYKEFLQNHPTDAIPLNSKVNLVKP